MPPWCELNLPLSAVASPPLCSDARPSLMEFPVELANQDVVEALIKHSDDDATIGLRIDACLKRGEPSSWCNFLDISGLEEKETLYDVARSGACQFSAVADQLFRSRSVTEAFRPDVYLRLLALHCVFQNQDAYQDSMLHAPVTRQQRQRGGGGVDMEEYTRRMVSSRCDGDYITLQALCDALKVNINVVKWTRADDWLPSPSDRCEQRAVYSPEAPQAAVTLKTDGVMRPTQSVFVADTLRPRNVTCLDPRTHRVQLPGRTLWLSLHGEAHFRSLRVKEGGAVVVKTEEAASGARFVRSGFTKLEEEASAGMGFVSVEVKTELREVMSPSLLSDGVSGFSVDVGDTERGSSRLEVTPPAMTTSSGVVGDVRTGVSDLESSSDLIGASERAFVGTWLSGGEVPTGIMPTTREGSGTSPHQGTPQDGTVGDKGKGRAEKQQRKRRQPLEDDEEEDVVDCSICMCAVTGDPDAASLDKCMHPFHFKCIIKWGETTNQCPMCKVRFNVVTRLRDEHVKRFRACRRKGAAVVIEEEEEEEEEDDPVAARAICMHCGEGGAEDRLILCDGSGCGNGAHTFCCGLAEVPSGEWFCPQCQTRREAEARRREANARRDAILVRAWAVDSNSEVDESEDDEEEEEDESGGGTIGVTRTRRSYSGVSYDVAGGGLTGAGDARRGLGLVMDDDRVDAFERGLVNSSGESNGEEKDDGIEDGLGMEDDEFREDFDHGDSPLRQPFTVDLVSSGASEGDSEDEEEEDAAIGVARVARASSTSRGGGGGRAKSSRSSSSSTRSGSGSGNRSRRTSSNGSRSAAGTKRRSIRKILGLKTTARSRGRGRGRGRGKGRGRTRRCSARGRAGVGSITGASLNTATTIATAPSSVARSPGPNLWPRVLASATSVVTPRHAFASVAQEEEEEKKAEAERGGTGGGSDGGLVSQSWADAERAVQMAWGSVQNRETSSTLRDKREDRVNSSDRNIAGQDAPDSGSGSLRSIVSTARSRFTTVGTTSTPSSTGVAGSPTTRRVFKRPRMMHMTSSPIMESPSSPPPQSLTVSCPGMSRVGSLSGVGGTVEGVGVGIGRSSCGSGNSGSGSGRAASRVQLLALVQRLRGMAIAERGRWRAERVAGRFTGAESVAVLSREGVDAVFEELKRAALDSDDTARETLLSSKLLPVLRLWLEPAADGRVSFLLAQQRSCLLEVLMTLPVKKNHLKESGIGKLMVSMAADPTETRENRELIKQIVKRWSQLVFNNPRETPSVSSFSILNQDPSRVHGAGDIMSVSSVGGGGCSGAIETQNARRASSLVTGMMTPVPKRPEYGASRNPALPSYLRRVNIIGSGSISSNSFLGTLNRSTQVGGGSSGGSGRGSGVIPKKPRQPEESNAERHRGHSDRGEGARFEISGNISRLVQEYGATRSTSGPVRRDVTDSLSSCSSSSPFTTSSGLLPRASSSISSIPAPSASSASRGSPPSQPVSFSAAPVHGQQGGDRSPMVTGVVNNTSGSSSAETYRVL